MNTDALATIRRILRRRNDLTFVDETNTIVVPTSSSDGYEIAIRREPPGFYHVWLGGWHDDVDFADEAVEWFTLGLVKTTRLRIDYRGSFAYRWSVEILEDASWKFRTGLMIPPIIFWRKRRSEFFHNDYFSDLTDVC